MAFDQTTRNRLQRFVSDVRSVLTVEFTRQLQNEFGLDPISGHVTPLDNLTNVSEAQRETARILRETLNHYLATSPSVGVREALERIIREQAFTLLNRIAALRMAEARGLLIESIGNGYSSKGFQLYARLAGSGLGETGDAYRCYVFSLFDEFSVDLDVLFDRFSASSRLFPREPTLLELLKLVNDPEIESLWAEDETIGWIYEYFNSRGEITTMRGAGVPSNSRELAVRNQFFTPRYVVEFLTDNTLGRIWYDMSRGNTSLKAGCRYLVGRPNEIFLNLGEQPPAPEAETENLSQEDLLIQPVHIPHRQLKDPREIRMLDPACGSMHFGLYAFDLFETIYTEAWELEPTGALVREGADLKPLREIYLNDRAAFLQDVPRLIIEHNIHGIDIDPRAVQIAGLSLWLRAQRSWQQQAIKSAERPQIRRSNIVCAEAMPGEAAFLEEFLESHFSKTPELRLLSQLVRRAFEAMKLAGEAGSLLKIEEEIAADIADAKKRWVAAAKVVQGRLFVAEAFAPDQFKFDLEVSGITDANFWAQAEERIYSALRQYAEQREVGSYQRRLFAEDAARGFAFIDLFRKPYDVVLMNPPFGEATSATTEYLHSNYPTWNQNLLCAFIERGWAITSNSGAVAAIFDRTAIVKSTYEHFRRAILIPDDRISTQVDLGWEVLDANVETTTCVLNKHLTGISGLFFDVRTMAPESKGKRLLELIENGRAGHLVEDVVLERCSRFSMLPNAVIGYDFPMFLRHAFGNFRSLESSGFKANQGFALKADKHFRNWWEVDCRTRYCVNRMFNGAGFAPYLSALLDCAISAVEPEHLPMDSSTRKSGIGSHRLPGVCFGKRGEYFCAHILPAGHIFTVEGQSIPVANHDSALELVAYLNTALVRFALNKYCGQHKYSGYVNLLPFAPFQHAADVRALVATCIEAIQLAQQRDELQSGFWSIPLLPNVKDMGKCLSTLIQRAWRVAEECEVFCDAELAQELSVSPKELAAIQAFRMRQPKIGAAIEDAEVSDTCMSYSAQSCASMALAAFSVDGTFNQS